jgi:hypothetical protein
MDKNFISAHGKLLIERCQNAQMPHDITGQSAEPYMALSSIFECVSPRGQAGE